MYYEWQLLGYAFGLKDGFLDGTHSSFAEKVVADCKKDAIYFVEQRFPGMKVRVDRIICKALDIDERL